jgi:hypothetical protein
MAGHQLTVATGNFPASHQAMRSPPTDQEKVTRDSSWTFSTMR